ncbi:MAG: globin [Chloroflexi bacterium AL-W]|nr:globin [Chloroflexi bacterium AL-N1]NOK64956.1 globin [Chloroflexi bacterium AL-N10]NOK76726.1 globin [Chloroflexi bacterium AL-N5]NOK84617.1 globin [Chloroflexi bacterium AL-W]NOK86558.1 globin [Chloroflexi bacterium AL-N15]
MTDRQTLYDIVGGDEPFRRLVEAFYVRVEQEPLLRPMYPDNLEESKEHLFLFITQYFGSPPRYQELRGHPRLRMRHAPFSIGQAERNVWLTHMLAAVDDAGFAEPARSMMHEYFERAATFLINRNDHPNSIELQG